MFLARRRSSDPSVPTSSLASTSTSSRARALFRATKPPPSSAASGSGGGRLSRRLSPSPRRHSLEDTSTSSFSSDCAPNPALSQQGSLVYLSSADCAQLLPHMRTALSALDERRTAVRVILAEQRVFVRPPAKASARWEDEWDAPPPDESSVRLSCVTPTTLIVKAHLSIPSLPQPAILQGVIAITSSERRTVDDVKLSLTAHQSLALKRTVGSSVAEARLHCPPEEFDLARWEASLVACLGGDAEGVELERGLNVFQFEFCLPADSSPSVCSSYGRLRYVLRSSVPGSGSLLKGRKLASRTEVDVVVVPRSREDAGELRFAAKRSVSRPWSGPQVVEVESDHLTLGASVKLSLTLSEPPRTTTILGLRSFIAQTVLLRNATGERELVGSPRRLVGQAGRRQGWEKDGETGLIEDWIAGSGKSNGDEQVVFDGAAWNGRGEWSFVIDGIIPKDNVIRPSTLHWTPTSAGLRFASELVVEALVSSSAGSTEVVNLYRGKVDLADASCDRISITLPPYTA